MGASKRTKAAPKHEGKRQRKSSKTVGARGQLDDAEAVPAVALAGRTEDPQGVGAELVKLIGGSSAIAKKGIRKTEETPPRYAIPEVIRLVKGAGHESRELSRLRAHYPEVFAKELLRVRERHGVGNPNWVPNLAVRFRDRAGGLNRNETPVATIHGLVDVILLLPGKMSAELRSKIVNVFVRFVGGAPCHGS